MVPGTGTHSSSQSSQPGLFTFLGLFRLGGARRARVRDRRDLRSCSFHKVGPTQDHSKIDPV